MPNFNYHEKILQYQRKNPNLDYDTIGTLILMDKLYRDVPEKDLISFRQRFGHIDPNILEDTNNIDYSGLIFLKIAGSDEPFSVIKHRLNDYINIKSYYIDNYKSYDDNIVPIRRASIIVSSIIDDILKTAKFPDEMVDILRENKEVSSTHDLYGLLRLYRKTKNKRIKFEVMRKIGLIVLIKRIRRTFNTEEYDFAVEKIKNLFKTGLGLNKTKEKIYYLWLDDKDKVVFTENKKEAIELYKRDIKKRQNLALNTYPLQSFVCYPAKTKFGGMIMHSVVRNKFRKNGDLTYSSFVEKIIRKNIEFPSQVRDVIGVKLIVENEDQVQQLIYDLEAFLGGSSTRKKEKNSLNMFGKKSLGKFSSKEYFVWKAVYDITLSHPTIPELERIFSLVKGNKTAKTVLKNRMEYYMDRPKDFVVEVQLQDLQSYLLSIAKGSPTFHESLKMNQIRTNSFYKMFPKEIYHDELLGLKKKMLSRKIS